MPLLRLATGIARTRSKTLYIFKNSIELVSTGPQEGRFTISARCRSGALFPSPAPLSPLSCSIPCHAGDQPADHLRDYLDPPAQLRVVGLLDEALTTCQLQKWDTFLGRGPGNDEKVCPIGFGETPLAFGEVGGDRDGGTVELID